jgi:hypothetical protein
VDTFLEGAEIDPNEPQLSERITSLRTVYMLEMIADPKAIGSDIWQILLNRLQAMLV